MKNQVKKIAIIGSGGAIGAALVNHYSGMDEVEAVYAFSRKKQSFASDKVISHVLDYYDESSLSSSAKSLSDTGGLDLIIVTTGILHNDELMPEKALKDLSFDKFDTIFKIDVAVPALLTKHFVDQLHRDRRAMMVLLTARLGSISDNYLGGWYSYRSAKSALNMFIKTASIEVSRRYKERMVVGIHPGTVDTPLSKPFSASIDPNKVFTPHQSAEYVSQVIDHLTVEDSGRLFAWDGQEIQP